MFSNGQLPGYLDIFRRLVRLQCRCTSSGSKFMSRLPGARAANVKRPIQKFRLHRTGDPSPESRGLGVFESTGLLEFLFVVFVY